ALGPFGRLARGRSARKERAPVAGKGRSDLRSGEKMLPPAQAGERETRDAARDRGRSHICLADDGLLRTVEHRIYRAGESDGPARRGWASPPDMGHVPTGSTAAGSSGVVVRLLPFCSSSRVAASGLCRASRARWQATGATLSTTDTSHGRWQNEPTMDSARCALVSVAAGFRLSGTKAR